MTKNYFIEDFVKKKGNLSHIRNRRDICLNFHKREHNFFRIYPHQWNYYNSHQWTVKVNRGDLLIFPSSLLHSVSNVKMQKKRCTLAFNTMIKGSIGGDDLTELTLR